MGSVDDELDRLMRGLRSGGGSSDAGSVAPSVSSAGKASSRLNDELEKVLGSMPAGTRSSFGSISTASSSRLPPNVSRRAAQPRDNKTALDKELNSLMQDISGGQPQFAQAGYAAPAAAAPAPVNPPAPEYAVPISGGPGLDSELDSLLSQLNPAQPAPVPIPAPAPAPAKSADSVIDSLIDDLRQDVRKSMQSTPPGSRRERVTTPSVDNLPRKRITQQDLVQDLEAELSKVSSPAPPGDVAGASQARVAQVAQMGNFGGAPAAATPPPQMAQVAQVAQMGNFGGAPAAATPPPQMAQVAHVAQMGNFGGAPAAATPPPQVAQVAHVAQMGNFGGAPAAATPPPQVAQVAQVAQMGNFGGAPAAATPPQMAQVAQVAQMGSFDGSGRVSVASVESTGLGLTARVGEVAVCTPSRCSVMGDGIAQVRQFSAGKFKIVCLDQFGNRLYQSRETFSVMVTNAQSQVTRPAVVTNNGDGTHDVVYFALEPGTMTLAIAMAGSAEPVAQSPYTVPVSPGAGVPIGYCGHKMTLNLTLPGVDGGVAVSVAPIDDMVQQIAAVPTAVGGNRFSIQFTPVQEGYHQVKVTHAGSEIGSSPFLVEVKAAQTSAGMCQAVGDGLQVGRAGIRSGFLIVARDQLGYRVLRGGEHFSAVLASAQATVQASIVDNGDGSYDASYLAYEQGVYSMSVTMGNGEHIKGSPFQVQVQQGQVFSRGNLGVEFNMSLTLQGGSGHEVMATAFAPDGQATKCRCNLTPEGQFTIAFMPAVRGHHVIEAKMTNPSGAVAHNSFLVEVM